MKTKLLLTFAALIMSSMAASATNTGQLDPTNVTEVPNRYIGNEQCGGANIDTTLYFDSTENTKTIYPGDLMRAGGGGFNDFLFVRRGETAVQYREAQTGLLGNGCNVFYRMSNIVPRDSRRYQVVGNYGCTLNRPEGLQTNEPYFQYAYDIRFKTQVGKEDYDSQNGYFYRIPPAGLTEHPDQKRRIRSDEIQSHPLECINYYLERCGDGVVNGPEVCDPNDPSTPGCTPTCDAFVPVCEDLTPDVIADTTITDGETILQEFDCTASAVNPGQTTIALDCDNNAAIQSVTVPNSVTAGADYTQSFLCEYTQPGDYIPRCLVNGEASPQCTAQKTTIVEPEIPVCKSLNILEGSGADSDVARTFRCEGENAEGPLAFRFGVYELLDNGEYRLVETLEASPDTNNGNFVTDDETFAEVTYQYPSDGAYRVTCDVFGEMVDGEVLVDAADVAQITDPCVVEENVEEPQPPACTGLIPQNANEIVPLEFENGLRCNVINADSVTIELFDGQNIIQEYQFDQNDIVQTGTDPDGNVIGFVQTDPIVLSDAGSYDARCYVNGLDQNIIPICRAHYTVNPGEPSIEVDKDDSTPGAPFILGDNPDTDGDDTQIVTVGGESTFTITVRNNGTVPLQEVELFDGRAPNCSGRVDLSQFPNGNGYPDDWVLVAFGDEESQFDITSDSRDGEGTPEYLDPGEWFSYACLGGDTFVNDTNIVTVAAKPIGGGDNVEDDDTTTVKTEEEEPLQCDDFTINGDSQDPGSSGSRDFTCTAPEGSTIQIDCDNDDQVFTFPNSDGSETVTCNYERGGLSTATFRPFCQVNGEPVVDECTSRYTLTSGGSGDTAVSCENLLVRTDRAFADNEIVYPNALPDDIEFEEGNAGSVYFKCNATQSAAIAVYQDGSRVAIDDNVINLRGEIDFSGAAEGIYSIGCSVKEDLTDLENDNFSPACTFDVTIVEEDETLPPPPTSTPPEPVIPACYYVDPPSIQDGEVLPFRRQLEVGSTANLTYGSCNSANENRIQADSFRCVFDFYAFDTSTDSPREYDSIETNCFEASTVWNTVLFDKWREYVVEMLEDTNISEPGSLLDISLMGFSQKVINASTEGVSFGEHKVELNTIKYRRCSNIGTLSSPVYEFVDMEQTDQKVCSMNFAVTDEYLIQRGTNVSTIENETFDRFYDLQGNNLVDQDEVAIANINTSSSFREDELLPIINNYSSLAVISNQNVGNDTATNLNKVPNANIYYTDQDVVFTNFTVTEPTTLIVDGDVRFVGDVQGDLMVVAQDNIIFGATTGPYDTRQTVQGIFVSGDPFAAPQIENNDLSAQRSLDGRLLVQGMLVGDISNLVEQRRSAMNDFFRGNTEQKINHILNGGSVVIETNISLFENLPPGADDAFERLDIRKN